MHVSLQTQMKCFTESQNGRGWEGPLWVTQPNPLPKQGHRIKLTHIVLTKVKKKKKKSLFHIK